MLFKNAVILNENFNWIKADLKVEDGKFTAVGHFDENGTDMVRFDISIESYSIYVGSRINGIVITMDGRTKKLDSGEITYASGPKKTFLLGSCTMEMLSATAHAEVSWDFFGSYKDTPMDQITASGEVRR